MQTQQLFLSLEHPVLEPRCKLKNKEMKEGLGGPMMIFKKTHFFGHFDAQYNSELHTLNGIS